MPVHRFRAASCVYRGGRTGHDRCTHACRLFVDRGVRCAMGSRRTGIRIGQRCRHGHGSGKCGTRAFGHPDHRTRPCRRSAECTCAGSASTGTDTCSVAANTRTIARSVADAGTIADAGTAPSHAGAAAGADAGQGHRLRWRGRGFVRLVSDAAVPGQEPDRVYDE